MHTKLRAIRKEKIAFVEVQRNEIIEFYEPSPGQLMISMAGAPEGGMMLGDVDFSQYNLRQVWDELSGGAPTPVALEEELTRQVQLPTVEQPEESRQTIQETFSMPEEVSVEHLDVAIDVAGDASHTGWCGTSYYSTNYPG